MKAKKILFTTSGVLKIVVSSLTFIFFVLILLLSKTLIEQILTEDNFEQFVNEMIAVDSEATFLQEMTLADVQEYFMSTLNTFCGIILFFSASGIAFGISNLVFAKKYDTLLKNRLGKKITFMIFSLILSPEIITNVLTIVALFLKDLQTPENIEVITPKEGVL